MAFVTEHDYVRTEFDWLAVDSSGHVGFFATGGDGPVPCESLESADELDNIHDQIRDQPKHCDGREVGGVEYYLGDFYEVAERGIYAYNWDFERKEYRLVVSPAEPIVVQQSEVGALAKKVKLAVEFADSPWIPATAESLAA